MANPSLSPKTAGLAVAGRLAENPEVSVAVLEAGEPLLDDPKILLGGGFASTWGDPKVGCSLIIYPHPWLNSILHRVR